MLLHTYTNGTVGTAFQVLLNNSQMNDHAD